MPVSQGLLLDNTVDVSPLGNYGVSHSQGRTQRATVTGKHTCPRPRLSVETPSILRQRLVKLKLNVTPYLSSPSPAHTAVYEHPNGNRQ